MACDPYSSSVVLALHMDGTNGSTTFTDSSPSAKTVTANGNAQISTAQSKFGGASAYFDGTADYLRVASSTDLELGASNFTIELWVRIESSSGQSTIFAHRASDITQGPLVVFRPSGTTDLRLYLSTGTSTWDIVNGGVVANAIGTGVWKHIAICRNGSTFTAFVDGVSSTIGSSSSTIGASSADWSIGGDLNNNYFNGYIDDLRITKGVARYTANFTPPTVTYPDNQCVISGVVGTPGNYLERVVRAYRRDTGVLIGQSQSNPTTGAYSIDAQHDGECFAIVHDGTAGDPYWSSVVLALHMDGTNGSTTFTDSSPYAKTVTANGNAQISTAQSKFGGASAYFDGTGDYLTVPTGAEFDLGTGDFTISLWAWVINYATERFLLAKYTTWTANLDFALRIDPTTGLLRFLAGDSAPINIASNVAIPTAQWVHIAVTRASGVTRLFIGGAAQTAVHTGSVSIPNDSTTLRVGTYDGSSLSFEGYIDDLRITKGVARYTANFTAPTATFLHGLSGGDNNALIYDRVIPA